MNSLESAGRALDDAASLPCLLEAARGAFEAIITLSWEHAEDDNSLVAAFAGILAAAADGRDAIAVAPSLPAGPAGGGGEAVAFPAACSAREAARAIAALSEALAARLDHEAGTARGPGDRAACRRAARYAQEVTALLGGGLP